MITYIKINDRYYPDNGDRYFYCGQCKQFKHVMNMVKNGYECKECNRKRAKEYYRRKTLKAI